MNNPNKDQYLKNDLPAILSGAWRGVDGCMWCGRNTERPTEGHDGFCPVPAVFFLVQKNNDYLDWHLEQGKMITDLRADLAAAVEALRPLAELHCKDAFRDHERLTHHVFAGDIRKARAVLARLDNGDGGGE